MRERETTSSGKAGKPGHDHGSGGSLTPEARAVLGRGLAELIQLTEGLKFRPLNSERYPSPLALAFQGENPDPEAARATVRERMEDDPVGALEDALVLLELYESNQPGIADALPDDGAFLGDAFDSKRLNGWLAVAGDGDPATVKKAVNERWQFKLVPGRSHRTGVYPLLNMLARYAFVYGRIPPGDGHALGHFIEDFGQGVVVCHGTLDDLELTLSLAAMKMGVPAVVPPDYPFTLGRQIRAGSLAEVAEAVASFPNIRRLLAFADIPPLPKWLDWKKSRQKFAPAARWGESPDSFYIMRKGPVKSPGVEVVGKPTGPLGVVLTAEAEPLDAFDREYIAEAAAEKLSWMPGVRAKTEEGRLVLELAEGVDPDPVRIGETLVAAVRHEFPRITRVHARIILDPKLLADMTAGVRKELASDRAEREAATEETVPDFLNCVGCSPFAPDHVCCLTPERPPQCGRPYGMIKAGALYGYDDMSNIHHRSLHAAMNSFNVTPKGKLLDPVTGEWSGINEAVARLSGGRTTRVQLHSLDSFPHTGCGCFWLIMFKTDKPRPGIGIMSRGFAGKTPDGRTWRDLHYALGGKQAPGLAGAADNYLFSRKFLAAHGGWKSVVWISPKIAEIMGDRLPSGVAVGPAG